MKLALSLMLSCSLAIGYAAVALGPADKNPDHPGKCWSKKTGKAYSAGESWQLPHCVKAMCTGKAQWVSYYSCISTIVEAPCYLVQNKSLPYPLCCPRAVCPNIVLPLLTEERDQNDEQALDENIDYEFGDYFFNYERK